MLAFLAAASCRHSPPDARRSALDDGADPGDARLAHTAHYALRIVDVIDCKGSGAAAPADTTRRLGVEIGLEPTSDVQVPANPYYARLVDERGQVFEATLGGCGPALAPSLPLRGQVARGVIVFDVPRDARHLTLLYMPELVGVPKEELSLALEPPRANAQ